MSFGIVEVITLLLGLSGFGLQPNPKAPTPDAALQYAIPDADLVVHVDAASLIPGNYAQLVKLADQPQIKASPELAKTVRQVVNQVEGGRGLVKSSSGIDLTTDVSNATLFVQFVGPNKEPNVIAAVRGKFSTANIDKIASTMRKSATKVGSGSLIDMGADDPSIAVTRDGVFLAGTAKLVRDRLADTWKAPARAANSNLAHVADVIAARPVLSVVMSLSPAARKDAISKMDNKKNFMADIVTRHKLAAFSMFHDGIGWTWLDSTRAGVDQMAMVSEGTLDVLRAAHIAPRGFAKIMLGAIDSYKGSDKKIDEMIRRKADLMKIVTTYTGDGNFKTKIDKDPAKLKLTVRATGKSLSEVLPAGALMPLGMFMLVGSSRKDAAQSAPAMPVPAKPATPAQPGTKATPKTKPVTPAPPRP